MSVPEAEWITSTLESVPILVRLDDNLWVNPANVFAVRRIPVKDAEIVHVLSTAAGSYVTIYNVPFEQVVAIISGEVPEEEL